MKTAKILAALIAFALLSSVFAIFPSFAATTVEAINPLTGTSEFFFDTTTHGIGDTFMARIVVKGVVGLNLFQIMIGFDPALLNVNSLTYTSDIGDYVFDGKTTIPTTPEINNATGYVLGGVAVLGTSTFSGDGTLCMVQFEIMAEPPTFGEIGPSPIDIITSGTNDKKPGFYTFILDADGFEISYTEVDGTYKLTYAAPTIYPYLSVNPALKKVGGGAPITITPIKFTVDVEIHDVDSGWQMVMLQFRLIYNMTLLNVTDITEGPFMQNPTWAPYGTVFANASEPVPTPPPGGFDPWEGYGQVLIGIVIWPDGTGTWNPPFPEGSGVICTIEFEVLYQEEFPWLGVSNLNIQHLLDPMTGTESAYFVSSEFIDIPENPDIDGRVEILGYVLGLQIDVYTQYGGQGINEPSDAFAPQATVLLCTKVTYNLDPVQFKIVNFHITGPSGNFEFVRTAMTDDNGVACIEFGLPWPCADYADCFGIWDVFASVEVREVVENDTLQFRVGWLVEIVEVIPDKFEWTKDEHLKFTVIYKTIAARPLDGIITMVVYDNLMVPIGQLPAFSFTVGGADLLGEKYYETVMECLTIPKWAFIGDGKVYTNAFTDWPNLGGVAYCPEVATDIRIILPP
jgi:hypothetical protein